MIEMMRDLNGHNGHANAAILSVIRQNQAAAADGEIWDLLHHILLANRFWMLTIAGLPFAVEHEGRPSGSFEELVQRYRSTHEQQSAWLAGAGEHDLSRSLEDARFPGGRCSVAQAFMQVYMHSHGHRAQLAKLLSRREITPPGTDFILWLGARSQPEWPA